VPHETTQHPEVEVEPVLEPGSPCGRALACCRAFAEVTPHVDPAAACAGAIEAAQFDDADARCDRLRIGWRVALEDHEDVDPPEACSAPAE